MSSDRRSSGRLDKSGRVSRSKASVAVGLMRSLKTDERGQSLVEMALVLPIFLAVLMGIWQVGVAMNHQILLTEAVDAGARHLQMIRLTSSDPCADTLASMKLAAPTLTASRITLTINMNGQGGITAKSCPGKQSELIQGGTVEVIASYPFTITILGVPVTTGALPARSTQLEY